MGLPRTFANAATGYAVESLGWTEFFITCALVALPGMVLLYWVAPFGPDPAPEKNAPREEPPRIRHLSGASPPRADA